MRDLRSKKQVGTITNWETTFHPNFPYSVREIKWGSGKHLCDHTGVPELRPGEPRKGEKEKWEKVE